MISVREHTTPSSLIPVIEIFGPTVQGEGMVIGQKTMFVRTAGCDYRCSWCDSAFTWDGSGKKEIRLLSAQDIWKELYQIGEKSFSHVTISGGNPALLPAISSLAELLSAHAIRIAVETQGSIWQDWLANIDEVTLSPKPPSSTMKTDWAVLDYIVSRLHERDDMYEYSIKIVVFDENDLDYARKIHRRYPKSRLFLQAGNSDVHATYNETIVHTLLEKYEWLINRVARCTQLNNVRILPQLHTLLWGNKRGV